MKKLILFYMICASTVFSPTVAQEVSMYQIEADDSYEGENFLDDLANEVHDVVVVQKKPTYLDYIKTAWRACYYISIKKLEAIKKYIASLKLFRSQRKKDGKRIE